MNQFDFRMVVPLTEKIRHHILPYTETMFRVDDHFDCMGLHGVYSDQLACENKKPR
jgi:hypothetical protein